ncbi:acetyl-CoA synthetase-like protein [Thelephora ganbajun]|uniref:Acetyl-CoA synthetase-like protein n=1 Tax=Thelephora ganbajun TaxID=370292 RepID=A0ACB6ZA58_THEGA|nr:acetyl-CoA synthetase-like protein [Thelephora ganbajun]
MTIYHSPIPDLAIPDESLFTFLFEGKVDREIPGTTPAFIDAPTGRSVTRSELKTACLSLGWGLRNIFAGLGGMEITRGDTVMIFSPNSFAWPFALFGSIAAGFKVTLANSSYTPAELGYQWKDSGAKVVFTHPVFVPTVATMLEANGASKEEARKRIVIMGVKDRNATAKGFIHMDDLFGKGSLSAAERFDGPLSNETAYLCYSSGTTGKPKGVESTHKNIISNCLMIRPAFPPTQVEKDVMLGILPFYHIFGGVMLLPFAMVVGSPVVIMPQFEPEVFCRNIEKYKVTISLIVPPVCLAILHHPATNKYNLKTLRLLMSGAAPLGASLIQAVHDKLKSVGAHTIILQGYGLTEMSPVVHILPRDQFLSKAGSAGILVPNLEARLVGDGGVDAKPGESGELWLRGPSVMKGYLNNPEATKESITTEGWYKTGDVCVRDAEGYYTVVDRIRELIKYKGFQVPPAEMEALLLQHPKIVDAAVVGVYSEEDVTELPRAYVVPRVKPRLGGESEAFSKEIQEWVQGRVAKHKFLRGGVVIIDQVPKSAAGKILRRQLRDLAKAESGPKPKL